MIRIPAFVQNLETYKPGKPIGELAREKKLDRIVKLASNENPFGPSPKAIEAITHELHNSHRYIDPRSPLLVEKLARHHDVSSERIVCGHGSDSLISYIINAFSAEGEEVLTSKGTFIGAYVSASKLGRKLTLIPMNDYRFDLDAIAAAISGNTRIIYLANPNNPTGDMISRDELLIFMAKVSKDILVILDEAYQIYASDDPNYPDGLTLDYPNLIVCRTMSKAYGLAGLRIGYAVGSKALIDEIYKVKLPFEPNNLAQAAATAALDDDEFLLMTKRENKKSLDSFRAAFDQWSIRYLPSAANFLLTIWPDAIIAAEFAAGCLDKGLILRPVSAFGIPAGVRINSGTEDETRFALDIIHDIYQNLNKKYNLLPLSKGQ